MDSGKRGDGVTGNLRKRMLEEEHLRELNRMISQESVEVDETEASVFCTFSETATVGDRTVTRSASVSVSDKAETNIDAVLAVLRRAVQESLVENAPGNPISGS